MVQVQHILASRLNQKAAGLLSSTPVIAQHAVNIIIQEGAVQNHHRHNLGSLTDVLVIPIVFFNKAGTHKHKTVHMPVHQLGYSVLPGSQFLPRAGQDTVILVAPKLLLQKAQCLRQIRISSVGAQQADGLHGVQAKTPGKGVGHITAFVNNRHDLVLGLLAHMGAVVQYPGYGGNGNASTPGNIINVHGASFRINVKTYMEFPRSLYVIFRMIAMFFSSQLCENFCCST